MINSPPVTLRVASTVFVEMVKYWRNCIGNILAQSERNEGYALHVCVCACVRAYACARSA